MQKWFDQDLTLRGRLQNLPGLDKEGLRRAQIKAIENLEVSFKNNRPKALIQMATGTGKTYVYTKSYMNFIKVMDLINL